jgi:hypothetical protein
MKPISTALMPYKPQQNYEQMLQDKAFQDSWQTQQNDLRLRDATDITGSLKLEYALRGLRVKQPHLFHVEKGEQSFVILGTLHVAPINLYPDVDWFYYNFKALVTEQSLSVSSIDQPIHTKLQSDESFDEKEDSDSSLDIAPWFEDLPERCQQWISDFGLKPGKSDSFLDMYVKIMVHFQSAANGMDSDLVNSYYELGKKIYGFETYEEAIAEEKAEEITLEHAIEFIQHSISNGGRIADPSVIARIKEYADGILAETALDSYTQERNAKWFERLPAILKQYGPGEVLVAVGGAHLGEVVDGVFLGINMI